MEAAPEVKLPFDGAKVGVKNGMRRTATKGQRRLESSPCVRASFQKQLAADSGTLHLPWLKG